MRECFRTRDRCGKHVETIGLRVTISEIVRNNETDCVGSVHRIRVSYFGGPLREYGTVAKVPSVAGDGTDGGEAG